MIDGKITGTSNLLKTKIVKIDKMVKMDNCPECSKWSKMDNCPECSKWSKMDNCPECPKMFKMDNYTV